MNKGFTLVELAIAIVIIGLLTVGIFQGQDLIKSSRINSTISKINSYNSAVNTFRGKYVDLPGDLAKPITYGLNMPKGGTIPNVCATDATPVTATAGGNGNGDNRLATQGGGAFCRQTSTTNQPLYGDGLTGVGAELGNFFVHLSNAQLVKESFSQPDNSVGSSYPSMPVGVGMGVISDGLTYYILGTASTLSTFNGFYGNNLSPLEAGSIDTKLDDGNPLSGTVQVVAGIVSGQNFVPNSVTASGTTCVFTGGTTYNTSGTYENSKLCTLKILGSF